MSGGPGVRHLVLVGGLLLTVGLAAGDGAPSAADPRPPDARSRFTRQTSEVWRYRQPFRRADLRPVPNNTPHPEPTPRRERPRQVAVVGDKAYVALAGTEAAPGRHLAVVDVTTGAVRGRIEVGQRPYQPVLHPGGRWLVVTHELSNYATVVDTTRDAVAGEIPLDYYSQGLVFASDGRRAWVANRYLDQVLVVDLVEVVGPAGPVGLRGRVREVGGFDDVTYFERLDGVLRARCGACHAESAGGYVAGPDPVTNFLSAVENAVGGQPEASPLWRAVVPRTLGGFGDEARTPEHHPGGVLFLPGEPETAALEAWIRAGDRGPGIPVGNPGSHPKDLALSADGRHLFVGNTGTMDVSVVDVEVEREVGALYLQSPANHLLVTQGHLIVLTFGAGFGATKARDPHGAETWDRDHAAAQLAVLRDPVTTDPLPPAEQPVLGPFDAVDGTWNFKMRDIQNDVVLIDLARLDLPTWRPDLRLDYLLRADRYEAHPAWVRYTSDTAEATTGDVKGDIPPALQRVPGAFPEWAAVVGDRLYLSMAGSFEVVEWALRLDHPDPALRLEPLRSFPTDLRPVGLAAAGDRLIVANSLAESATIIDRASGDRVDVLVGDATRPPLDTDAEKGELIAHTTVFSSDGDTSCLHCH